MNGVKFALPVAGFVVQPLTISPSDSTPSAARQKELAIARFLTQMPGKRYEPAEGEATLCGVFVETDPATGLAIKIEPIRIGGRLQETT